MYLLTGTGPSESCGPVEEAPVKPNAAPAVAPTATPIPQGMVGDGEHFININNGSAPTPPSAGGQ